MALLLSPTVSFLVSPSAPRSRALSAAANVSYPGKLCWCASSIPVVLFEFNSPLYAVLAGWGRFLGWMPCPISCNPRMELRMRGIWSLWLCWSSPRHFCAYVMLLARSGISSNINRAAAISSSVSYALNILELYQSGQERWNTKFAPSLLYLMPITVLDLISNKVIRRTSLASCYSWVYAHII